MDEKLAMQLLTGRQAFCVQTKSLSFSREMAFKDKEVDTQMALGILLGCSAPLCTP